MNPLWVFWLLPLVMAPVIYGIQRMRHVAAGLAIAACLLNALAAWRIPIGTTTQILSATLTLTGLNRFGLSVLCMGVAAALAYAAWQPQGWAFAPFLLLSLTFTNIALLIQPQALGILLGQLAALFLLFPLQGAPVPTPGPPPAEHDDSVGPSVSDQTTYGQGELRRGAIGYLAMMIIVAPCILLALWLLEHRAESSNQAMTTQLLVVFLGLGSGILLTAIPLHLWWLMIADDAPPLLVALIGAAFPSVGISLLVDVLSRAGWLVTSPQVPQLMLWGGTITALLGGLLSAPQRQVSRLIAYSAVHDAGVLLVGLGTLNPVAMAGVVFCLVHRAVALGWLAIAHIEFRRRGALMIPDLGPIAARLPVATTAFLLGGLALSGWPLSGGFAGRWLIYSAALPREPWVILALVAGSSLVAAGYLRTLRAVLEARTGRERLPEGRETLVASVLLLAVSLLLALTPNLLLSPVYELLADLPFPPL